MKKNFSNGVEKMATCPTVQAIKETVPWHLIPGTEESEQESKRPGYSNNYVYPTACTRIAATSHRVKQSCILTQLGAGISKLLGWKQSMGTVSGGACCAAVALGALFYYAYDKVKMDDHLRHYGILHDRITKIVSEFFEEEFDDAVGWQQFECAISTQYYGYESQLVKTPCGHLFERKAIEQHLTQQWKKRKIQVLDAARRNISISDADEIKICPYGCNHVFKKYALKYEIFKKFHLSILEFDFLSKKVWCVRPNHSQRMWMILMPKINDLIFNTRPPTPPLDPALQRRIRNLLDAILPHLDSILIYYYREHRKNYRFVKTVNDEIKYNEKEKFYKDLMKMLYVHKDRKIYFKDRVSQGKVVPYYQIRPLSVHGKVVKYPPIPQLTSPIPKLTPSISQFSSSLSKKSENEKIEEVMVGGEIRLDDMTLLQAL